MKVGDKVRICEDLHHGGKYKIYVTENMAKLAGQEFRIVSIIPLFPNSTMVYTLSGDACGYYWTSDMFDYDYGAVTEETMENKNYDAEELSTLYEL